MKQLFNDTKISSVAESVSELSASDKIIKDKCMDDVFGSSHADSEVASSLHMLNDLRDP